jgi:hypothetical protein
MSPAGMSPGPEGGYLVRARALCVRGEALGGRLVAWGTALLALGWDIDKMEKAVLFAASIREEALTAERAWASGMAEGDLESLSPDGQGILAWGPALLSAASLAHLAKPGDVLVDDGVRALRAGQLSVIGTHVDTAEQGRGYLLDLDHPWKRAHAETEAAPQTVGASLENAESLPDMERLDGPLTARIRKLANGGETSDTVDALAELRRARARVEGGSPSTRCQAALALAMTLSIAGRPEEALLDALDALARSREAQDPKATAACMALLAKLYAAAGLSDAANALRESITAG